jgi:DNA-directed RNA polymerase specialized sigma subunit
MERKNYLKDELTKEEKLYLKKVILNTRRLYIRDNYDFINSINIEPFDIEDVEAESLLDAVINKCEKEIESAVEFEKVISDTKMYKAIKALSLKEKIVLFSLYKENKTINQIALEMKIDRTTTWRIKSRALDKIMKYLIGGEENV